MKILIASESYHMMNGVAGVVTALVDTFRACGHDVKVLGLSDTTSAKQQGDDYFIPSFPVPLYPDLRQSVAHRHRFVKRLIEWKPDIIHVHTEGSVADISRYISKKTGAPIVMTMHTDYTKFIFHSHDDTQFAYYASKAWMATVYRRATLMITPSVKAKNILKHYSPKHKVAVIPNGIKLDLFKPVPTEEEISRLKERFQLDTTEKLLVCVSRLSKEKNIEEIIEFFPSLLEKEPKARLLIVGDGPDKAHLEKLVKDYGLSDSVKFSGRAGQNELYKYYKLGKAFVSASTFEMHSLTFLEAMACGLPLLCHDDPCLLDVLYEGENGFTFTDRESFTLNALKILDDEELQKRLSDKSLENSKNFDDYTCAQRTLELYRHVIDGNFDELCVD